MDNNNERTDENGTSFITEKIKPKTRRRIKKILEVCGLALLAGVIIGFVGRLFFDLSEPIVSSVLGIENNADGHANGVARDKVELSLNSDFDKTLLGVAAVPEKVPVGAPTQDPATPDPVPPTTGEDPTPTVTETPEDEKNPITLGTENNENKDPKGNTGDDKESKDPKGNTGDDEDDIIVDPMESYVGIVGSLKDLYSNISTSIVTVRSYSSGVNWLDESIETYVDGTGVILGENGVEMLIMSAYNKTESADRIEVILKDNIGVEGQVFLSDPVLDLVIIAVKLESITPKEKANLRCICIGDSDKTSIGDAVLAAGMTDGYLGSMSYGYVTATDRKVYVQDGVLDTFATGFPYHEGSDGVVVNMSGEMIGIISHFVEQNENDRITCCISINSIKDILIDLLNGRLPVRPGIRAEDIPGDVLEGMGLKNGIYVNEVLASSPAAEAGLRKGDVIITLNEVELSGVKDLMEILVGDTQLKQAEVSFYRSSQRDDPMMSAVIILDDSEDAGLR